jgi:ATP-dependent RNA helicase DDX23/PRP28
MRSTTSSQKKMSTRRSEQHFNRLLLGGRLLLPCHRLTAMFSATVPPEAELMAGRCLRHPVDISIGDQDSSKNARIVQRVVFVAGPSKKESAFREPLLQSRFLREKIIVFVKEKKHADGVGRTI